MNYQCGEDNKSNNPNNIIYIHTRLLENRPLIIIDITRINEIIYGEYEKDEYVKRVVETFNKALNELNSLETNNFIIFMLFDEKHKNIVKNNIDIGLIVQLNKLIKKYYIGFIYKCYVIGLSKKFKTIYKLIEPFINKKIRDLVIFRNNNESDKDKQKRLKKELKQLSRRKKRNEGSMTDNIDLKELNKYLSNC